MPEGILDFFELVWAESQSLDSRESKKDILYTGTLYMYLDERDNRTDQMQALRIVSHGTLQVSPFFVSLAGATDYMPGDTHYPQSAFLTLQLPILFPS